MEVSEVIAIAREKAEAMARLARVLSRLKPTIYATGTVIRLRNDELALHCTTVDAAMQLAAALPSKLDLAYHQNASTTLYGSVRVHGVVYHFEVPTIRKIHLEACELKRRRRSVVSGWQAASLLFNGLEIAKLNYRDSIDSKALRMKLWETAIRLKADNHRMEKFEFVL